MKSTHRNMIYLYLRTFSHYILNMSNIKHTRPATKTFKRPEIVLSHSACATYQKHSTYVCTYDPLFCMQIRLRLDTPDRPLYAGDRPRSIKFSKCGTDPRYCLIRPKYESKPEYVPPNQIHMYVCTYGTVCEGQLIRPRKQQWWVKFAFIGYVSIIHVIKYSQVYSQNLKKDHNDCFVFDKQ